MYPSVMYGRGIAEIGKYYVSPQDYIQRGRGFGGGPVYYATGKGLSNVFRGIFSFLAPLVKKGGKFLGKELLRGGADVLEGLEKGDDDLKTVVKRTAAKRIRELSQMAEDRLNDVQTGSGIRSLKRPYDFESDFIHGTLLKPSGGESATKRRKVAKKPRKKQNKKRKTVKKKKVAKKRKVSKPKKKASKKRKVTKSTKKRKASKKRRVSKKRKAPSTDIFD